MITLNLNDQIIKSLSKPELGVLKYAYENTEQLLGMTIQALSEQVRYSPATILRFCKKLGYSGFAEFKYALRAELRAAEAASAGAARSGRDFNTGVLTDTISSNIQATSKLMQEEHLEQAFRFLDSGCPIYLWSPAGSPAWPWSTLKSCCCPSGGGRSISSSPCGCLSTSSAAAPGSLC